MDMKPKTNELDLLPVTFLKENIEKFVGLLVNIVNISLQLGVFAKGMEDSTVTSFNQEGWSRCYKVQFSTSFKFVIYLTGWWKKLPLVNWFNMQTTMIYHPIINQHIKRIIVVKHLC